MSAMSNARTEGGEEEKQQDFFTSFRELTMEMRQNETRDERRETRDEKNEKNERRSREEGKARERRARENATKGE